MDIVDKAQEIEAEAMRVALLNHQAKQNLLSRHFCLDCDIVIPKERLEKVGGGCLRCIDCQTIYEEKTARFGSLFTCWGERLIYLQQGKQ